VSETPEQITAVPETIYDAFTKARERTVPFDPSASPLFEQVGFIVGAPRSGTTWLQQLLFVHPQVATSAESHLFCEALSSVFENFRHPDRSANLGTWVSEGEFLTITRTFCDSVFAALRDGTRPNARIVLEKTPNHRMQSAAQAQLYPDAHYVHIIRDGRDATASQRHGFANALKEFTQAGEMAEAWAAEIRDIRTHFGSLAYLELRYEDVVADTPAALAAIFDHLGLPHDRALCEAAADFGRAPVNTFPSSVEVGIRKHRGDALAERSVARAAGDLLTELGYADAQEIAQLRRLRTRETMVADARQALTRVVREAKTKSRELQDKARGRADRREHAQVRELANAMSAAVEAGDAEGLAAVLSPRLRLNGAPATSPKDAADALIGQLGGSRSARRSVSGGLAQLTFVSDGGQRFVVRVKPDDGLAAEVDVV
jgi:LPS sulfotransferase NodH